MLKYLFGISGDSGFGSASTAYDVATHFSAHLKDKVAIVTGCTSGIGKETVASLAEQGVTVIMACRNSVTCQQAVEDLKASRPHLRGQLLPMQCDMASFTSIRDFVTAFQALQLPLHILINNAGVMMCEFSKTADGHELQFGTNHLGHFLLTELLLGDLTQQADNHARIVNVSSIASNLSYPEGVRFDTLNDADHYDKYKAYGQSKLSNCLHVRELNERFTQAKCQVVANACHPGVIASELQRHVWFGPLFNFFGRPFHKNPPQGAATSVYLACAPELKGGAYYADCNPAEDDITAKSRDVTLWRHLRQVSFEKTSTRPHH